MKSKMKYRILATALVLVACSPKNEWSGKTDDFVVQSTTVGEGPHVFVAMADKPILCELFRNGLHIPNIVHEEKRCTVKFESSSREDITFVIRYKTETIPNESFKYHASIIN